MELKEFITQTLSAIVEGVAEAQEGKHGGNISPAYSAPPSKSAEGSFMSTWGMVASPVRFDVALTVSDSGKAEGSGKIAVLGVSVGGGGSSMSEQKTVSRVQFEVPVAMPTTRQKPHKVGKDEEEA